MRAGRLVSELLILRREGRVTAARLAERLEVSERTVLRDMEALAEAGVPVYGTRGPGGGLQLLGDYEVLSPAAGRPVGRRRRRRATLRISPEGRRLAALLPRGWLDIVVTRSARPDGDGWHRVALTFDSPEVAALGLLALGGHVEVLEPAELRADVARRAAASAALHG